MALLATTVPHTPGICSALALANPHAFRATHSPTAAPPRDPRRKSLPMAGAAAVARAAATEGGAAGRFNPEMLLHQVLYSTCNSSANVCAGWQRLQDGRRQRLQDGQRRAGGTAAAHGRDCGAHQPQWLLLASACT